MTNAKLGVSIYGLHRALPERSKTSLAISKKGELNGCKLRTFTCVAT